MSKRTLTKEQTSMFAPSNFKSAKDGGVSPFDKGKVSPWNLDSVLDDGDFSEEEWDAFETQLDQRLAQPRKPLSPGAQELQDKMDQAEWEFGMREQKTYKITKKQLAEMIQAGVKKALSEQATPPVGPRTIDLDNNEWRQLSKLFSNIRSRKIQLEGLERSVKHLLDNHDPMAAYAIAKNYSDLLKPDEIALLKAISGK